MADGQHTLSRRALLGAVCASPLLPSSRRRPGPRNTDIPEPDAIVCLGPGLRRDDEWNRALARFRTAQAAVDAASGEPDQDRYDALLDSATGALCALLALPAPDLPALAAKLDIIVPHLAWEHTGSEDCLEILRQDAHRLAAAAA